MPTATEILARINEREDEIDEVRLSVEAGSSLPTEHVASVMLLKANPTASVLAAAWPTAPRSIDPEPAEVCEAPESEWVRWYWSRLEPDPFPLWIRTAGLPDAEHVRRTCLVLIDNGIVLPDGRLTKWAGSFIKRYVFDLLGQNG